EGLGGGSKPIRESERTGDPRIGPPQGEKGPGGARAAPRTVRGRVGRQSEAASSKGPGVHPPGDGTRTARLGGAGRGESVPGTGGTASHGVGSARGEPPCRDDQNERHRRESQIQGGRPAPSGSPGDGDRGRPEGPGEGARGSRREGPAGTGGP